MNKKYIKFVIIGVLLLLAVFIYFFITLNPQRKSAVQTSLQNLFPFGQPQTTITGQTPDGETITIDPQTGEVVVEQTIPRVRQITTEPVAGYQPLAQELDELLTREVINDDGTTEERTQSIRRRVYSVRYVKTQSGNIEEATIDQDINKKLLTDEYFPNIEEAFFNASADRVVMRYFNEDTRIVQTYFGSLQKIPLTVELCPFAFPVNTKLQDQNKEVANIQRFLNGFLGIIISETGENSPGNETGIFDELTQQAVATFQEQKGLNADGVVGQGTRTAFLEACNEVQTKKAEALFAINNPVPYYLQGIFGQQNIATVSRSIENVIAYLYTNNNKNTGLFVRDFTTNNVTQLYDTPFSEWIPQTIKRDLIMLTTKASAKATGYLFELNSTNKTFKKILGPIQGLTTLVSPDGIKVLYSSSQNSSLQLHVYNKETREGRTLGLTTLPEKCVWASDSIVVYCAIPDSITNQEYPDTWYKGLVSFNDTLWSINTQTGATERLINLNEYIQEDANLVNLTLSPNDRYLFFTLHDTKHLWVADLFF